MSNIRAIKHVDRLININQGGGSKKQGIPSSTNLNTWSHVAFRNRNVVCPCNRNVVFCMNQLGGIGAGGIPGRSYMFAPNADGVNKTKILCNIDHSNIPSNILKKITYKKLLLNGGANNYLPLLLFNINTLNFETGNSFINLIKDNLQPNKHYIIEYTLTSSKHYRVFFTIVKNNNNPIYNSFEIKNISPSINISGDTANNIKLYELVTKYT